MGLKYESNTENPNPGSVISWGGTHVHALYLTCELHVLRRVAQRDSSALKVCLS